MKKVAFRREYLQFQDKKYTMAVLKRMKPGFSYEVCKCFKRSWKGMTSPRPDPKKPDRAIPLLCRLPTVPNKKLLRPQET
jgi:hypothetical protein